VQSSIIISSFLLTPPRVQCTSQMTAVSTTAPIVAVGVFFEIVLSLFYVGLDVVQAKRTKVRGRGREERGRAPTSNIFCRHTDGYVMNDTSHSFESEFETVVKSQQHRFRFSDD
jgi:hypothetical protein